MLPAIRPMSKLSLSGVSSSGPTKLAPLTFDKPSDLRIVLVPTAEEDTPTSQDHVYDLDRDGADLSEMHISTDHNIPNHPVPSMQEAFSESLLEATDARGPGKPKLRDLDAKARREKLIEQAAEDDPFDAPWRYRPGQEQHEVYKLISQITFGVYLLLNNLAADNSQVVAILQGHIDEVDEFLEVMLEDFAQANQDLTERISHLQLPMGNRQAFECMLEDRNFRAQILAGNEKIDHILARTNAAMKQWDDDIDAGLRSSEAFMEWLNEQKDLKYPESSLDLNKIYQAMKGNADGWLNAFDDLNNQAQDLNGLVIKLMTIVAEMEKTAGEVSRKTWANIPPFSLPVRSPQIEEVVHESPLESPARPSTAFAHPTSGGDGDPRVVFATNVAHDPEVNTLSDFPLPERSSTMPVNFGRESVATSVAHSMLDEVHTLSDFPIPDRSAARPSTADSDDSALTFRAQNVHDGDVDTLSDFPLPGCTPLLPPSRMSLMPAPLPATTFVPPPAASLAPPAEVETELPTLSPTVYDGKPKKVVEEPRAEAPRAETPRVDVSKAEEEENTVRESVALDDGPLYILQPRTYTPQPPEPLPSPMMKPSSPPQLKPQANPQLRPPSRPETRSSMSRPQSRAQSQAQSPRPQSRARSQIQSQRPESRARSQAHSPRPQSRAHSRAQSPRPHSRAHHQTQSPQSPQEDMEPESPVYLEKRTSLRQRVSQKTTPPESIHIPPRNAAEARLTRPSTGHPTLQTHLSIAPDDYISDLEVAHHHRLPRATSHADFSAQMGPHILSSPLSEQQQFYHPVRASPHSPLQQRPHTADAQPEQFHSSGYFPGHVRQQPSRTGGMSTLSSVTTATYDDAATMTSRGTSAAGGRRVKKKKSAFGWLKKAFSLDEDEKADYQARKAMQYQGQYFDDTSPKFLDGKRIR